MKYYALQVKTKSEERFVAQFKTSHPEMLFVLQFPQRELLERRAGQMVRKLTAVFPGYIFAGFSGEDNFNASINALRQTKGFYRFLRSNNDIVPLAGKDLEIVLHFLRNKDSIAGLSKVFFNQEDKIMVLEGALKGLEGKIIKVDRRKGRAKISLDLYDETFCVDLGFEIIEPK